MSMKFVTVSAARIALAALILCLVALAFPKGAAAASVHLNPISEGDLRAECHDNGGTFGSNAKGTAYACNGSGGTVSCVQGTKDGKTSTYCEGTCGNCSDMIRLHGKGNVGAQTGAGTAKVQAKDRTATSDKPKGTVQSLPVTHKPKPVLASRHQPLKSFASRSARIH